MDEDTVGYVVVERNQASGVIEYLNSAELFTRREDAAAQATESIAMTRRVGRREEYYVARVVLDEVDE